MARDLLGESHVRSCTLGIEEPNFMLITIKEKRHIFATWLAGAESCELNLKTCILNPILPSAFQQHGMKANVLALFIYFYFFVILIL